MSNESKSKLTLSLPSAVVIAGIMIAGAVLFRTSPVPAAVNPADTEIAEPAATPELVRPVDPLVDHILGNPNAPIKIVEYSDLDCPFCERFHGTMEEIVAEYPDQVAWVYRHFPLSFHPGADDEAVASECVAKLAGNDAFWKFLRAVLPINSSSAAVYDPAPIVAAATALGINADQFTACTESGEFDSRVADDLQNASETGGSGTPWSIIILPDGSYQTINGAQPTPVVREMIDNILSSQ